MPPAPPSRPSAVFRAAGRVAAASQPRHYPDTEKASQRRDSAWRLAGEDLRLPLALALGESSLAAGGAAGGLPLAQVRSMAREPARI